MSQIYKGVSDIDSYQEILAEIDNSLRSNPSKYMELRADIIQMSEGENKVQLETVLDIFHGSHFYFQNNLDSANIILLQRLRRQH